MNSDLLLDQNSRTARPTPGMSRKYRFPMKKILLLLTLAIYPVFAAQAANADRISKGTVGRLSVGMPTSSLYKVYPKMMTKTVDLKLEGFPTPAIEVYRGRDRHTPSLVLRLDNSGAKIIGIEVNDQGFRTDSGIGVGSTLGQLRQAYRDVHIAAGEGETFGVVDMLNTSFRLDTGQGGKPISDTMKIVSIWVH